MTFIRIWRRFDFPEAWHNDLYARFRTGLKGSLVTHLKCPDNEVFLLADTGPSFMGRGGTLPFPESLVVLIETDESIFLEPARGVNTAKVMANRVKQDLVNCFQGWSEMKHVTTFKVLIVPTVIVASD